MAPSRILPLLPKIGSVCAASHRAPTPLHERGCAALQDSNFSDLTISIVGVAATQKAHISITTDQADSVILRFAAPNSIGSLQA